MACTLAHTRGSICFSSPQVLTLYVYKRIFGWSHQSFWISQFCRRNMTYLCVCRCVWVLCVCQDLRCSNIFLRVVGQADLHVWGMTGISPFFTENIAVIGRGRCVGRFGNLLWWRTFYSLILLQVCGGNRKEGSLDNKHVKRWVSLDFLCISDL